jgi:hypothetical protein
MRLHARAEATRPSGNNSLRSIRSRTRRRLHEPRPPATPEIRARIGQWKAEVKAACLARYIGKGDHKYALDLLNIPGRAFSREPGIQAAVQRAKSPGFRVPPAAAPE